MFLYLLSQKNNPRKSQKMKNALLAIGLLLSSFTFSQNTFPTNGNVGINTSSPSAKLDVNGNMIVDSSLTVKDSVVFESDSRTKGRLYVEDKAYFLEKVYMNEKLILSANAELGNNVNVSNNVNVTNNVNIDNKLNVSGTSNLNGAVKLTALPALNNLNNSGLELVLKTPNGALKTISLGELPQWISDQPLEPILCIPGDISNPQWGSGVNKIFSACPQVNVGIGTNDPLFKLEVIGSTHISGNIGVGTTPHDDVQVNVETSKQVGYCINHLYSQDYGYAFKAIVNNENSKGIGIYNSAYGKDVFTVYGDGKIEVSSQSGKILQLDPSGILRSRHIKVDLDNWADYVFTADYNLMSLKDIEEFINSEGHLPKIPSASEVKENGLDLGEMQTLQMEKIEEMYLHMIELDKKIDALETEVDDLKQENELLKNK